MRDRIIAVAFLLAGMSMAATTEAAQDASSTRLNALGHYFRPAWKARCSVEGGPATIVFTSIGGDATEDDMQAVASWPDGSSINLGLKPGLFPQSNGFTSSDGGCEGIGVTVPRQDQMLLWIERDDRPSGSRLALVLLDTRQHRVLDVVNDAGKQMWGSELCWTKSQPDLYETVLVGSYQDRGQAAEPLDLPRTMRIEVVGNQLKLTWGEWVPEG